MSRWLSSGDQQFFALVSRAAFANPFGHERDELDRRIAGGDVSAERLLAALLERLTERVAALDADGVASITDFVDQDRELMEHAIWFLLFHRYADELDAHIDLQLAGISKDGPAPLPFASTLDADLAQRGFPPERRVRAVELFFQMRRAFRFIGTHLVGPSASMRSLRESLWNNIFTHDVARYERLLWDRMEDFSTILIGETGTGKGAAAAALGRSGFIPFDAERGAFREGFDTSFLPLNLSEYPDSLIESELFGHKKGAFTGAVENHEGALSRVSPHGVIFLDEIGEVSTPVQVKLLRVLQDRAYTPVGSHESRRFAGRVVAATHRDLRELRATGRLRDDFYYRLCSDIICVPALRQRLAEEPQELPALIHAIIPRLVGESNAALEQEVHEAILTGVGADYAWPGNVRELEQSIRRVLLTKRCQPDAVRTHAADEDTVATAMREGALDAKSLLARYCAELYERHGTYERVSRITGLDRRTVKKHVEAANTTD